MALLGFPLTWSLSARFMAFMAQGAPVCPWGFLALDSSLSSSPPPVQHKSFAQALNSSFDISLSQLPRPCVKGDSISIKISEEEYQKGLEGCKNNLHDCLLLAKGNKPIKSSDLRAKLSTLWKPIGQWKMIPLGRGFYEFNFAFAEDLQSVWAVGSWNLQLGLLRLS